jgi:hypothetical protein
VKSGFTAGGTASKSQPTRRVPCSGTLFVFTRRPTKHHVHQTDYELEERTLSLASRLTQTQEHERGRPRHGTCNVVLRDGIENLATCTQNNNYWYSSCTAEMASVVQGNRPVRGTTHRELAPSRVFLSLPSLNKRIASGGETEGGRRRGGGGVRGRTNPVTVRDERTALRS